MPQASERSLAMPMIKPFLPAMTWPAMAWPVVTGPASDMKGSSFRETELRVIGILATAAPISQKALHASPFAGERSARRAA